MFDPRALLGSVIDNRYRLLRVVGTGAFGTVFAADELAFGRQVGEVAVKLVRPPNDSARDAITREVRAMGNLTHTHLLAYRASGEVRDGLASGCLFIATELASETLADHIDSRETMGLDETVRVARHMASALVYLHGRHAIHRDVKPANILKVGDTWKLGDFGLVRELAASVVQMSGRKGTVVYMAPEAMAGEGSPAGDVWSLGVVLQLCLTGLYPYSGNGDVEVITRAVTSDPVVAQGLPEPLGRVVRGCLVKDRRLRWTAARVAEALMGDPDGLAAMPVAGPGPVILDPPPRPTSRTRGHHEGRAAGVVLRGHMAPVDTVAFSPDGALALTGSKDGTARVWDVADGSEVRVFRAHGNAVRGVAFTPSGRLALTGGSDRVARLWDVANGREICRFEGHTNDVCSVAVSPDGNLALTGSADSTARVWDVATGREIRRFGGHGDAVLSVAISPDGQFALSTGRDRTAQVWVVSTGRAIRRIEGLGGWVRSGVFSPDGLQALICGGDATARLWNVESGGRACTFEGHGDAVLAVDFSPDGETVLTAGRDRTARLWDAATAREIHRYEGHTAEVKSVAFAPDGSRALTGSGDGTARMWKVEL